MRVEQTTKCSNTKDGILEGRQRKLGYILSHVDTFFNYGWDRPIGERIKEAILAVPLNTDMPYFNIRKDRVSPPTLPIKQA